MIACRLAGCAFIRGLIPVIALVLAQIPMGYAQIAAATPAVTSELIHAVRVGDASRWRTVLSRESVQQRDSAGNTGLHFAALNHDLPAINALLAVGADANASNSAGATPLLYVAGHAGVVAALLERGANANATSAAGGTPLMAAVLHPAAFDAVRLLIEAGADVRAAFGQEEAVMLNRALVAGDRRTIELLLARGAIVDPKTGPAPLTFAAVTGDVAAVRLLLDRGAAVNYNSDFAGHALNWALYADQPDVARLLIERGADLRLGSPWGHGTPPMVWAAYNQQGSPDVAKALIGAEIDVNAASDTGATALSYALRSGPDTPLVDYLRSIGAKEPPAERLKKIPHREVPTDPLARAAYIREQWDPLESTCRHASLSIL